jgi:hypothetical protein
MTARHKDASREALSRLSMLDLDELLQIPTKSPTDSEIMSPGDTR